MRILAILVAMGALLVMPAAARADLYSSFDTSAQSWNIIQYPWVGGATKYWNTPSTFTPTWVGSGGYLSGYISEFDPGSGIFFFNAPSAWLGDDSAYIGEHLTFCLKTNRNNWTQDSNVVLRNGNQVILCGITPPPLNAWTGYDVQLKASNFKWASNGTSVTDAEFQAIMSNLTGIHLPGEYGANVEETTSLDEVRITPAPAAVVLGLMGLGTLGLWMRRYA